MTSEDFTPSRPYGVERQFQIYMDRRQGKRPTLPVAFEALEQQAKAKLSPETWGFLADGAGSQDTVQGRLPLLFDSGIRGGADAFKALALGAHAILLCRPYLRGLALGGEQGVREVVLNFLAELDLTLALSGYSSLQSLDRSALVREV